MRQIRVAIQWDGQSWRVPLPTYVMVPGSFLPVTPLKSTVDGVLAGVPAVDAALGGASVLVMVPDYALPSGPFTDAQWAAHLDDLYPQPPGTFKPTQK